MAATANRVQSIAGTNADPSAVTLSSEPIEGNLLVAIGCERGGTAHADFVLSGITGWIKRWGLDEQLGDSTHRFCTAVWTKIAGASEGTSVSLDNGTSIGKELFVEEYELTGDATGFSFLEYAATAYAAEYVTSPKSTGNTPSVAGDAFLLIATAAFKYSTTSYPTTINWTTAANENLSTVGTDNQTRIGAGYNVDSTTGVRSDSTTFDGSQLTAMFGLLVFELTTSGGGIDEKDLYLRSTAEKKSGANEEDLYLRTPEEKIDTGISLSATITAASQTSSATLLNAIPLTSTITIASQTSAVSLIRETLLAATITAVSQTSSPILVAKQSLSATITAASQTSTPGLDVQVKLSVTITATSQVSSVELMRRLNLSATIIVVSDTPDAIMRIPAKFPSTEILDIFTGITGTMPPNDDWTNVQYM
jgi:hypothetical protein